MCNATVRSTLANASITEGVPCNPGSGLLWTSGGGPFSLGATQANGWKQRKSKVLKLISQVRPPSPQLNGLLSHERNRNQARERFQGVCAPQRPYPLLIKVKVWAGGTKIIDEHLSQNGSSHMDSDIDPISPRLGPRAGEGRIIDKQPGQ